MSIFKSLIKLADKLDKAGLYSEANMIDKIISTANSELPPLDIYVKLSDQHKKVLDELSSDDFISLDKVRVYLTRGKGFEPDNYYDIKILPEDIGFLDNFIEDLKFLRTGINDINTEEKSGAIDDFEKAYEKYIVKEIATDRARELLDFN